MVLCLAARSALIWTLRAARSSPATAADLRVWGMDRLRSVTLVQRHDGLSPWFPMCVIYRYGETLSDLRKMAPRPVAGPGGRVHFHQDLRRIVRVAFATTRGPELGAKQPPPRHTCDLAADDGGAGVLFGTKRWCCRLLTSCSWPISRAYLMIVRFKVPRAAAVTSSSRVAQSLSLPPKSASP